ncbi:MAG: LamG-like jellyroll fold domain-containing protein [Candidatus Thermoplasmatota archaeon]|nr:LamG-like jellyroll fold domain-containing protein [Candidatus Thermoplasmatota archaeon]
MWKNRVIKTKRANNAVSEIIGVILLLSMAVALFSVVYLFVMHDALDTSGNPPSSVTVFGTIGAGDIILEHRGGEALSLDTKIMITISGIVYNMSVGDLLDNESKEDGKWSVGEKLSYGPSIDITGRQIRILVIDAKSGSPLMQGILQEGETSVNPIAITRYATDVTSYSAKLWMDYDLKNYSGYLGFAWKPNGGNWTYSSPPLGSGAIYSGTGSYTEVISGLHPNTLYCFKAQLRYESTTIEGSMTSFFTLGWEMAIWHLNESTGTIAFDSSGYSNDGTLKPSALNGPQWVTGINESALSFDGIDDYVEVPDDDTLDITSAISIETWVKPLENSEGLVGDIKLEIDASEFGVLNAYEPDMIHVSGDIYAIVCRGTDNDGFLVTIEMASDGLMKGGYIDILEFDTSYGYEPNIIHINGDVYAVAYRGPDNDGFVKTVEIASDGQINNSIIDSLEFDTNYGGDPNIIHINGTVYAIAHTGVNSDGYVTTVQMENNGSIADSIIDSLVFDVADVGVSEEFNIIHVNGTVYAIAYRNPDSDGYLKTVGITNGGHVSVIDTFSFDTFDGYSPSIIHVSGTIYAVAYGGFGNSGFLKTVEIANDGQITGSIIDSLEADTYARDTTIIHINGDVYAVTYRGPDNDGFIKTVEIASDGEIDSVIDSLEFDTSYGYEPNIIHINGDIYAVVYRGSSSDGFIKTVEIANDGQITNSIIDTLEFGVFRCYYPKIIHINGDVYAMVYRGWGDDGFLKTVKMANDGTITDKIIDTLEFDKSYCYYPHIVHVNGDVYAISYTGPGYDGFLKTIEIANNGTITDSVIDSLEFDTSFGYESSIIHVVGDVYAIAYTGSSWDGFIKTVEIANNGTITDSVIDSLEFDTSYARYSDIVHANGTVFAIAYTGSSWDGFIKTVEIANNGTITDSVIDSLEFDTSYARYSDIVHANGTVFAIAYTGPGYDGFLKTIEIANNGTITDSVIDSLEFDTSYCYEPDIICIADAVFAITYTGPGYDGFLKTLRIGTNGNIVNTVDDSLEFDTSTGCEPSIIHVDGTAYAIAYRGPGSDGFVKTIEIDLKGTIRTIVSKDGAYGITANSTRAFATINTHTNIISAPISPGFNHIVFTYNKDGSSDQLRLYINGTEMANGTLTETITINTNDLYFGKINAIIDEIKIYGTPLAIDDVVDNFNLMKP